MSALHRVMIAAAQRADVLHHVDLLRADAQSGFGFGHFGFGGGGAQRKSDHGADLDGRSGQLGGDQRHPVRIDADAGETVLARFAAHLEDVVARGVGPEQRVVDQPGDGGIDAGELVACG